MKSASMILIGSCLPALAGNISPVARYAYDTGSGWIDLAPPVADSLTVGSFFLKGYAYSANLGWINFGSTPSNGFAYSSVGTDQGVNCNPVTGDLSGFAYASNTGWIRFGWAGNNDPNRPRVTLSNGAFSGFAYGTNIGWLSLSTVKAQNLAIIDSDFDGMDDAWEISNFGNLISAEVGTDWDKDGQSDASEFIANTLPKDASSWLRIVSYAVSGTRTTSTLTFTSSPARLYQVEISESFGSWSVAATDAYGSDSFPGAANATITSVVVVHPANSAGFFRVSVRKY